MPTPVTLNPVPKSFGDSYFWIAAFKGDEETGPFGLGDCPTEAMKDLVAESVLTLRPASGLPVFTVRPVIP